MPRKYRDWSREEYDRLEALLKQGLTYAQAAVEMGRETLSVQGAAQRIGLMSHERLSWRKRKDWPQIDALLAECIETRLMTVPQAAKHITALGYKTSAGSLYERLKQNPDLKKRARMNAQRRMASVGQRVQRRRKAA